MTRCWALAALFPALLFLTSASPARARTWYVKPDSTGDVPTISVAVDSAAAQGDTVLLADGTYTGIGNRNIRYHGKSLTIMSRSRDPALCTVDCQYIARGFIFDPGDGTGAVLEGITIYRGRCVESVPPADSGGGGIWCDQSSPTIRSVVISRCDTEMFGGGMYCSGAASPVLADIIFTDNNAAEGGGMYCKDSSPELTDVTFFDNYAGLPGMGGGMFCDGGAPLLTRVQFLENMGDAAAGGLGLAHNCGAELRDVVFFANVGLNSIGGLYCYDSSPLIENCTFSWNWGSWVGAIGLTGNSSPVIRGCTFYKNAGDDGGAIACYGDGSPGLERTVIAGSMNGEAIFCGKYGTGTVILSCCDIYGNVGGDWVGAIADQYGVNGNISADPLFCDTLGGDFRLETCSLCLPGNHPDGYDCGMPIGAFCSGCACGGATVPITWGAIKAMYR